MAPRRGLIIAIEQYALLQDGLPAKLEGTHQSALDFRRWLIDEHGVAPGDIRFCAEDRTLEGWTAGATRPEIAEELGKLKEAGFNRTEHLCCYLAGHGFAYVDGDDQRLADVLVLADYRRRDVSGNECLKIDELQIWLSGALGPGDHFYFVDCCRNWVTRKEISVGVLGLGTVTGSNGLPTIYTLYSTIDGAVAAVGSGFSRELIRGLKGTGRAKVWRDDEQGMEVRFEPVSDYVRGTLAAQEVDARRWGNRKGIICEFVPAPRYELRVTVVNADPADRFTMKISTRRGLPVATAEFTGSTWSTSDWPPDAYVLELSTPGFVVEPQDPLPADLYEPCTIRFAKRPALGAVPPAAPSPEATPVVIRGPEHARLRVRSVGRGQELDGMERIDASLPPDRYHVDVMDWRDVAVRSEAFLVEPGPRQEFDLSSFSRSPLRNALLARLPHSGGSVDFSETLGGPTPDQGLDLWLATIGAARILQESPAHYSKLGPMPLASFFDLPPGAAPLFLLAGFDEAPDRFTVTQSGGRVALPSHPELPGLFEWPARGLAPGCRLVTLEVGDLAPMTVVTATLPNRITLLVLAREAGAPMRIRQLVLPVPHLVDLLPRPPGIAPWNALNVVRRTVEIQRHFEGGRELAALLDAGELEQLLYLKWFEPISCLLGAYELARRGLRDQLEVAVGNLRELFPELPDTSAIAKLAGFPSTPPDDPPLVLDGVLAWNLMDGRLPLPASALEFGGLWTVWRGA